MKRVVYSVFTASLFLSLACGGDDSGTPAVDGNNTTLDSGSLPDGGAVDAAISAECLEAKDHSDLEWIQAEIFTKSCAGSGACHKGAAMQAEGLNLENGMSEGNMVGVASQLQPEILLVAPGNPEESYLMQVLGQFPGPVRKTMPLNSSLLCKEKRDAVQRWIESLPINAVN